MTSCCRARMGHPYRELWAIKFAEDRTELSSVGLFRNVCGLCPLPFQLRESVERTGEYRGHQEDHPCGTLLPKRLGLLIGRIDLVGLVTKVQHDRFVEDEVLRKRAAV